MSTPVIPTLMSDISMLKHPVDIIKYVLRWYMYVPKNINDSLNEQEISFRYTDAKVGHDRGMLANASKGDIEKVLKRYFPNGTIDVAVATSDYDTVRYDITFDIVIVNEGKSYSISRSFRVDSDGYLVYNFDGE
jgi:hypothetical protein